MVLLRSLLQSSNERGGLLLWLFSDEGVVVACRCSSQDRQLARSRGERKVAMNTKRVWNARVNEPQSVFALSDVLLSELVTELDNDDVTAIILRGSYARGDAVPYS